MTNKTADWLNEAFRGFIFLITVEVLPVVGPHIAVGEDHLTFQISAGPMVILSFS
jgi:hypothetical protein